MNFGLKISILVLYYSFSLHWCPTRSPFTWLLIICCHPLFKPWSSDETYSLLTWSGLPPDLSHLLTLVSLPVFHFFVFCFWLEGSTESQSHPLPTEGSMWSTGQLQLWLHLILHTGLQQVCYFPYAFGMCFWASKLISLSHVFIIDK